MKRVMHFVAVGVVIATTAFGGEWPQFCGPDRNNVSDEAGLAKSWPKQGPEVLWTVDVTTGYAGPAIRDGRAYLLGHDGENSQVHCFSFDSGKTVWSCDFDDSGELKNKKYPGTRGTPTVTDDSLYAVSLFGTVVCVDLKSHKVKWQRNMTRDFGKVVGGYGEAQSPLLYGDLVVVAPLSDSFSAVALDKDSGDVVWTLKGYPGGGFVSPSLISVDGEDQILMVVGGENPPKKSRRKTDKKPAPPKKLRPTYVLALSPEDGKVQWSYDQWSCNNPIPHPIQVADNTFFITSGYKSVSTLIRLEKKGRGYDVQEVWKTEDAATQIEQPVFVNNHLFVGGTVKAPKKGLVCMDLDGEVQWNTNKIEGAPSFEHVNMLAVDGMLIALDGDSGLLHLIDASPEKFKELASVSIVKEKGQTWAPIAFSDGKLLVRDHIVMKCLNLKP